MKQKIDSSRTLFQSSKKSEKGFPETTDFDMLMNIQKEKNDLLTRDKLIYIFLTKFIYTTIHQIVKGLASGNGISFSPMGNTLWVAESFGNRIFRIDLLPDGLKLPPIGGVNIPYRPTGDPGGPDSNKMDAAGNLYQAIQAQGRVIILNQFGVPVANVIVPGREEGKHLKTANLAFKPGTNIVYLMAAGEGGAWIYTFPGLAPGLTLYSHQ